MVADAFTCPDRNVRRKLGLVAALVLFAYMDRSGMGSRGCQRRGTTPTFLTGGHLTVKQDPAHHQTSVLTLSSLSPLMYG